MDAGRSFDGSREPTRFAAFDDLVETCRRTRAALVAVVHERSGDGELVRAVIADDGLAHVDAVRAGLTALARAAQFENAELRDLVRREGITELPENRSRCRRRRRRGRDHPPRAPPRGDGPDPRRRPRPDRVLGDSDASAGGGHVAQGPSHLRRHPDAPHRGGAVRARRRARPRAVAHRRGPPAARRADAPGARLLRDGLAALVARRVLGRLKYHGRGGTARAAVVDLAAVRPRNGMTIG